MTHRSKPVDNAGLIYRLNDKPDLVPSLLAASQHILASIVGIVTPTLIIGHGAIDFPAVLGTMARMNYRGNVSLELYPYADRPETAGEESLARLRPLFETAGLGAEG